MTATRSSPKRDELLFLPLGGAGEIGMNLNLYGHAGKWLMVDLGVTFGDEATPGVDVIMPDPPSSRSGARDLVGLVAHPRARGPYRRGALSLAAAADARSRRRRSPPRVLRRKLDEARLANEVADQR